MSIRIVTDSTCDLPDEIISQQGITVVPMYINIGNESYQDGINLTREEFYERLPRYPYAPKTATPSIDTFLQVYDRLANEGAKAILSIHISEALSATVNAARTAAEQFTRIPSPYWTHPNSALAQASLWKKRRRWQNSVRQSKILFPLCRDS